MTFKIFQCITERRRNSQVPHRGYFLPRCLKLLRYNSTLDPNSDSYFPGVQHGGKQTGKLTSSKIKRTLDPLDNDIAYGGVNNHNTLNISLTRGLFFTVLTM